MSKVTQIHDRQRGIRIIVMPPIQPHGSIAKVVIVSTVYTCACCKGDFGRVQTLQLCCN